MLLTRSPLSPKSASTSWIPFDLHVLSTPPAFILSQDQTLQQKPKTSVQARKQSSKNKHQQSKNKTFQNHQHQKNKKQKKTKTPTKTSRHPSSIPHKQNKKTHYREHKQPNHKPTKLAGQDPSRAKNKRRESFSPAGLCARQRIQSYRPGCLASNQNA